MSNSNTGVADRKEQTQPQPVDAASYGRINVETLAKNLAFFGLSCYIIGLITVNMYLFDLGFSDFTPINPRFIATGMLVFSVLVINVILPILGIITLLSGKGKSKTRKIINRRYRLGNIISGIFRFIASDKIEKIVFGFGLIIAPIVIFWIILRVNGQPFDFSMAIFWLVINIVVVTFMSIFLFRYIHPMYQNKRLSFDDIESNLKEWLIFIFASFIYLVLFTSFVYPVIPEQFGGGQPKQITILFETGAIIGIRELGVPIPNNTQLSLPVMLLFESSDRYILRLQNNQVISIDKKLVQGIRVESN